MKIKKLDITTVAIIIIAFLLLMINVFSGVLLMNESKTSLNILLRQRMLDIANTAADMINGDDLGKLTEDDKYSPQYRRISDTLAHYQNNIDLEYIYCVKDTGNKSFVFTVDPTVKDPGEFGEAVTYTEALFKASRGTPAVDEEPYEDKWGRFYSAYSPVFDSRGNVAGIVAVDFSAYWYDEQLNRYIYTTLFGIVVSLLVGAFIIFLFTGRQRKKFRLLNAEVDKLSYSIEELTNEIYSEYLYTEKPVDSADGGKGGSNDKIFELETKIRSMRESIGAYIDEMNSRANGIAENANRTRDTLISVMNREIRTPLNSIIGLVNIASNDRNIADDTRGYLEKINTSAQHLLDIINDTLDLSRIGAGDIEIKTERFALAEILRQINTMISGRCYEKELEYECRIVGLVDEYYIGDDKKITQILMNILVAAAKYTSAGGSISMDVETKDYSDTQIILDFSITVIGAGKAFRSVLSDGNGSADISMAVAKSLVRMMGGSIKIDSKDNGVTILDIKQPLTRDDTDAAEAVKDANIPAGLKALIIDDDPVSAQYEERSLNEAGISCELVSSGLKGVKRLKQQRLQQETYGLILINLSIPAKEKIEIIRQLRFVAGSGSHVIFLAEYDRELILEEAVSAGADDIIYKPVFASELIEKCRMIMNSGDADGSNLDEKADLTGCRVLVAEDVMINAEIIIMILKMRGLETEHAKDGKDAVDMFASHDEGYYDFILMDMIMPEIDGLTAAKMIRDMNRDDAKTVPIIALTANVLDEDIQLSLNAGLDAHLSKPVDPETLFETMEGLKKHN